MSRPRPWMVRAYAWALWVLPRRVRREDGAAMADTFEDLWAEGSWRRLGHAARAFGRLPLVAVAEVSYGDGGDNGKQGQPTESAADEESEQPSGGSR